MFPVTRAFRKRPIPKLCIHVAEASTKNKYAMADTNARSGSQDMRAKPVLVQNFHVKHYTCFSFHQLPQVSEAGVSATEFFFNPYN